MGAALWAVRMLLLFAGGWLSARGVGDSQLWDGLANHLAGPLVMIGASLWSYRARQAQLAHIPESARREPQPPSIPGDQR
jgi:hypothetical protein